MLVTENRTICIVVKLDQIRPPQQEHRKAAAQQHTHHRSECGRPMLHRAERRLFPAHSANQRPHLAAAAKKVRQARGVLSLRDGREELVVDEYLVVGPQSAAMLPGFWSG